MPVRASSLALCAILSGLPLTISPSAAAPTPDRHQPILGPTAATPEEAPAGFWPGRPDQRIVGASLPPPGAAHDLQSCAAACLALPRCNTISWAASTSPLTLSTESAGYPAGIIATVGATVAPQHEQCELSQWGPDYTATNTTGWTTYSRLIARNDSKMVPAIRFVLEVPIAGVRLDAGDGGNPFATAFAANLDYLRQYPVNDVLFWFRQRAGVPNPHGARNWGWDGHGPDAPVYLKGSVAGLFMMGLGGALRWQNDTELWSRLAQVVGTIAELQESDGYAMAFPREVASWRENPDYVTSWVTHGLLEAHAAGLPEALPTLRRHFDWFNYATEMLAEFLPPCSGPGTPGNPWSGCQNNGDRRNDHDHAVYLIKQGIIHNTRLASSEVGTLRDVQVVSELYQETWWLEQLVARNLSAIWLRHYYPHNYEITAFEAYLDMYVLTGQRLYLDAMDAAWGMLRDQWIHVGGSIAINEGSPYPPGSYFLDGSPTGELCGSSFWIRLNQRFHRLRPANEVYQAEIERSLLNVILANQAPPHQPNPGIRYFAVLLGKKAHPSAVATCCESQGTRTYGALPEFIFSMGDASQVFVNLFVAAAFDVPGTGATLTLATKFPASGAVTLTATGAPVALMLRIPSWIAAPTVDVTVRADSAQAAAAQVLVGVRGSFLELQLAAGGSAELTLPIGFRLSGYNGTTPDPGPSGGGGAAGCAPPPDPSNKRTRAALEYGPVLLAAVASIYALEHPGNCTAGAADMTDLGLTGSFAIVGVDVAVEPPTKWLSPEPAPTDGGVGPNYTLTFSVRDNPCVRMVPYFEVQFEEMTVYPPFQPRPSAAPKPQQCDIMMDNWPAWTAAACVSCPVGQAISNVTYAQYGVIRGSCAAGFAPNASCVADPAAVRAAVAAQCIGEPSCAVMVNNKLSPKDPCTGVHKQLAIEVACGARACGVATENFPAETNAVTIGCNAGSRIAKVLDAEFGVLVGGCTAAAPFRPAGCHADSADVRHVIEARCLGKTGCTVPANVRLFGRDPCAGTVKQLGIRIQCQ